MMKFPTHSLSCYLPLIVALVGCRPTDVESLASSEQIPVVAGGGHGTPDSSSASTSSGGQNQNAPSVRIGTWNLHNFSRYGISEYRIDDISSVITDVDADVLGVQELKVKEGTVGEDPQAWSDLVSGLGEYEGLHNPWNTYDTTVGLLYKTSTTSVTASRALFEDDSYAFPRPPLEVSLSITKNGVESDVTVIVLHLKAFGDSVDRRRAACDKLANYLAEASDKVVIVGDLNDDPYDAPADNAFEGTFLDSPDFQFLTMSLPPESVTSLGWHHFANGARIDGEFLDHVIVNNPLANDYSTMTPTVFAVPESERPSYESAFSDHFPVVVDFTP